MWVLHAQIECSRVQTAQRNQSTLNWLADYLIFTENAWRLIQSLVAIEPQNPIWKFKRWDGIKYELVAPNLK